jgi:hypothetical protein
VAQHTELVDVMELEGDFIDPMISNPRRLYLAGDGACLHYFEGVWEIQHFAEHIAQAFLFAVLIIR